MLSEWTGVASWTGRFGPEWTVGLALKSCKPKPRRDQPRAAGLACACQQGCFQVLMTKNDWSGSLLRSSGDVVWCRVEARRQHLHHERQFSPLTVREMIEEAGRASGLWWRPRALATHRSSCAARLRSRRITMPESHRSGRYGQGSEGTVTARNIRNSAQVVRVSKTCGEARGYGTPFILPSNLFDSSPH